MELQRSASREPVTGHITITLSTDTLRRNSRYIFFFLFFLLHHLSLSLNLSSNSFFASGGNPIAAQPSLANSMANASISGRGGVPASPSTSATPALAVPSSPSRYPVAQVVNNSPRTSSSGNTTPTAPIPNNPGLPPG